MHSCGNGCIEANLNQARLMITFERVICQQGSKSTPYAGGKSIRTVEKVPPKVMLHIAKHASGSMRSHDVAHHSDDQSMRYIVAGVWRYSRYIRLACSFIDGKVVAPFCFSSTCRFRDPSNNAPRSVQHPIRRTPTRSFATQVISAATQSGLLCWLTQQIESR